jgi:hypothetical protein
MSVVEELLNNMFKPARILLIGESRSGSSTQRIVERVCACEIDEKPRRPRYDAVLVDLPEPKPDLLSELKREGPLVLVKPDATAALAAMAKVGPLILLLEITEESVAELFSLLKIKTRTAEVAQQLATMPKASDISSEGPACEIRAA